MNFTQVETSPAVLQPALTGHAPRQNQLPRMYRQHLTSQMHGQYNFFSHTVDSLNNVPKKNIMLVMPDHHFLDDP